MSATATWSPDARLRATLTLAVHGQGDGADAARMAQKAGAPLLHGRALWQAAERAWAQLAVPGATDADADTFMSAWCLGFAGVLQRRRNSRVE